MTSALDDRQAWAGLLALVLAGNASCAGQSDVQRLEARTALQLEQRAQTLAVWQTCRSDLAIQWSVPRHRVFDSVRVRHPSCGLISSDALKPENVADFAANECKERSAPFSLRCREVFVRTLVDRLVERYPQADYSALREHCTGGGRRCQLDELEQLALTSHNEAVGAWLYRAQRNLAAHQAVELDPKPSPAARETRDALAAAVQLTFKVEKCPSEPIELFTAEATSSLPVRVNAPDPADPNLRR